MVHRWDPVAPHPGRLVRPVRVDPTGERGPRKHKAAGRYWRRTGPGLYVPADTRDDLPEQRIVEVAARLPAQGRVPGWAACRLWGAGFLDGLGGDGLARLPVPVTVGPTGGMHNRDGVRVLFHDVPEGHRAVRHRVPTVSPVWATYDAVRLAPGLVGAVTAIDMMCAAELVSLRMLADSGLPFPGTLLGLASEHARSPQEVRLRLLCRLATGVRRWLVNCAIHDLEGRFLGEGDLVEPGAGLVVEFDGAEHRRRRRHARDVVKEDALRRAGLEVCRVTGTDLGAPESVIDRVVAARERAILLPSHGRRYLLRPRPDDLHARILEREARRALDERHAS